MQNESSLLLFDFMYIVSLPLPGMGVFLRGDARVGSVVALVPGLIYGSTQVSASL